MPYKTATGTIVLQVVDVNDNCPTLTSNQEYVCADTTVVNVTGYDEDGDPNGPPLSFSVVSEKSRGHWRVEQTDGKYFTSTLLLLLLLL